MPENLVYSIVGIFVILAEAANGNQNVADESRIIGGYIPAKHTLAKHIVSLQYRQHINSHFCGGTIIAPDKVLTAAHCIDRESELTGEMFQPHEIHIVAGTLFRNYSKDPKAQIIDVEKFSVHKGYFFFLWKVKNDIAILSLKANIKEDGITAQRIPIATKRPVVGSKCTAIGWGVSDADTHDSPFEVNYIDLEIISNKECREFFRTFIFKILNLIPLHIRNTNICGLNMVNDKPSGKGICFGDSGGPLFCDGSVVGIASFVVKGCKNVGAFTNVASYYDWIQEHA